MNQASKKGGSCCQIGACMAVFFDGVFGGLGALGFRQRSQIGHCKAVASFF
jgi:hypothetical protein